jgi:aspartyl/asparaginyl beta-hydroxylase (cupin superfamily)
MATPQAHRGGDGKSKVTTSPRTDYSCAMTIDRAAAEDIARAGVAALQAGDGDTAAAHFSELVSGGHATTPIRLMLARSCALANDLAGEASALDDILAADPKNVRALLMRGDCYRRAGDSRAAVSFFQSGLSVASALASVPPELAGELRQAQAFLDGSSQQFVQSVASALADSGGGNLRMQHAVEMLSGERQVFPQEPSVFYVPYLPQRQFYEPQEFAWTAELESQTAVIKAELLALIEADASFEPYVQPVENRPRRYFDGLLNNPNWSAFYLWKDGTLLEDSRVRCPRTVEALETLPLSRIGSRTPSVLFSLLRPGAHIPPHNGMLNSRLICHLPLIVPEGCWLRVGNETRSVEEGKMLIFDDSIEHEAKNDSGETRIILLFDIWRPELNEAEQRGISAIFEAIDRMGPVPDDR